MNQLSKERGLKRVRITFLFWGPLILLGGFLAGGDLGVSCAIADDVYTFVVKKQEEKERYRWSLADWLTTRDKMRMQDLWLALHSPSPYEYYLGGNYQFKQSSTAGTFNGWQLHLAAFSSIFGLEARYESGLENKVLGLFNLRIFGFHDQATNITLQVGLQNTQNGSDSFRNLVAGVSLTLYLARFFGVEGIYRRYFLLTPNASGVSYQGDLLQGGAFIDFKFLRIYGDYLTDSGGTSTQSGALLGTKIYF